MNVREVKKILEPYLGKMVTIKYNLGRNKYEKYQVVIKELYDYTFLTITTSSLTKSFSYSDIITKIIMIEL